LNPSFNVTLTFTENLVSIKAGWHDGGDDQPLESSGEERWICLRVTFEVGEGVAIGVVWVYSRVNFVF
jgi:hypothetical protein